MLVFPLDPVSFGLRGSLQPSERLITLIALLKFPVIFSYSSLKPSALVCTTVFLQRFIANMLQNANGFRVDYFESNPAHGSNITSLGQSRLTCTVDSVPIYSFTLYFCPTGNLPCSRKPEWRLLSAVGSACLYCRSLILTTARGCTERCIRCHWPQQSAPIMVSCFPRHASRDSGVKLRSVSGEKKKTFKKAALPLMDVQSAEHSWGE